MFADIPNDNSLLKRIQRSGSSTKLSIFEQASGNGRVFATATPQRSYEDGGNWKYTTSGFKYADLLILRDEIDEALEVMRQHMEDNASSAPSSAMA